MKYVIAWKKVSMKNGGSMVWKFYQDKGFDYIDTSTELGKAWSTTNKALALKLAREFVQVAPFANVLKVTDKEMFNAKLKGT